MPKATVTIDLPDGWELAEPEPRTPNVGDWYWLIGWRTPQQAVVPFAASGSFIVRRIAEQYVNVRLRRTTATHFSEFTPFARPGGTHNELIDACREALRERCGWATGIPHFECLMPAGHAGEHGV